MHILPIYINLSHSYEFENIATANQIFIQAWLRFKQRTTYIFITIYFIYILYYYLSRIFSRCLRNYSFKNQYCGKSLLYHKKKRFCQLYKNVLFFSTMHYDMKFQLTEKPNYENIFFA